MEIPVVLPAPGIPGTPSGSPNPNTGSYTQIATPAGTSHAISNKSPGTYYYKVAACNGAGNTTCSAQSAASSGVTVNGPAPGIPGTPSGSPNPNTGSYTVSFSAASGSVGLYRVYESTSATGSYTQIATPAGTSHAISNKSPGTYYYKVAACNGAGNTTCSAQSAASSGVVVNAAASETVTYLHSDTLGNVIGESQADGTFTRYHYKPYGERVESQPERLGFTGHLHQKELGLTYMQARHFDPLMGRFYGNDPVSFTPGNVFSFNRYGYGDNNPYKYSDPDGRNRIAVFFFRITKDPAQTARQVERGAIAILRLAGMANEQAPTQTPSSGTTDSDVPAWPEAEAGNGDSGKESKGAGRPQVGECPTCGGETSNKPGEIAQDLGKKPKEVKEAIHGAKGKAKIDGNPDVEVCKNCGEIFPQTENGTLGDSIGNVDDGVKRK